VSMDPRVRPLAGVDLNLLKALDALLQERSVTRAAQRLSLTQPTISAALARLRLLFDDELLVRTGRTMRPTPFAEALAVRVRELLGELEDILASHAKFDPASGEQTFRVLATDYSALILIHPLMETLATEAPNVRIYLESRDIAEHADRLQRSEIDLAIVPERFSRTTTLPAEPLFSDRFVAVAWRGNTEVSDPLTFEQLAQLPYLTYSLGPLASMVDTLLRELGHWRRADTRNPPYRIRAAKARQLASARRRAPDAGAAVRDPSGGRNAYLAPAVDQRPGPPLAATANPPSGLGASGLGRRQVEGGTQVARHQVEVLVAVAIDEAAHERAERQHEQPGGACLRQRGLHQPVSEPLPLESWIDQRVRERDQRRPATILRKARELGAHANLEA
jgi:DNA-binding transcriptional LysR family regulator